MSETTNLASSRARPTISFRSSHSTYDCLRVHKHLQRADSSRDSLSSLRHKAKVG